MVKRSSSQGKRVQNVATRQQCGAVSLRCDVTQRDGAAQPAWVMRSFECPASSLSLYSHWRKCSGITGISVSSLFGMRLQYLAVWTVKRQISAQTSINDWFESFRFLSYYSFGPHKLLMVLRSLSASLWFFWPARDFDGTPPISFKDSFIHSTLNFRFTLYR